MSPDPRFGRFEVPPGPEEQLFQIIGDYQRGRLSLDQAAPRLRDALQNLSGGLNLAMSPSLRRLFAEAAKLSGHVFPFQEPDPNRHADGGRELLQGLLEAWGEVRNCPAIREPCSIDYNFAAATEDGAWTIATWLESQNQRVQVQSPTEADSDDWRVYASTPEIRWTQTEFNRWVQLVRSSPLGGQASFTGWSI